MAESEKGHRPDAQNGWEFPKSLKLKLIREWRSENGFSNVASKKPDNGPTNQDQNDVENDPIA